MKDIFSIRANIAVRIAEAYSLLGVIYMYRDWNWEEAIAEAIRSQELDPLSRNTYF